MKQHIKTVNLRTFTSDINSICQYLTEGATKMTGASCPDFTTAIPYWQALHRVVKPLQEVQNSAAKLILKSCREKHGKPLLEQLHWLPIEQRIKYKISCLCYQIIICTAPQYLDEVVQIYVPSRFLSSSSDDRPFRIPTFPSAFL